MKLLLIIYKKEGLKCVVLQIIIQGAVARRRALCVHVRLPATARKPRLVRARGIAQGWKDSLFLVC